MITIVYYLRGASFIIEEYIRSKTYDLKENEMQLLTKFKSFYKESLILRAQDCYRALLGLFAAVDLPGIQRIKFRRIQIDADHSLLTNFNELDLNKIYQNL